LSYVGSSGKDFGKTEYEIAAGKVKRIEGPAESDTMAKFVPRIAIAFVIR